VLRWTTRRRRATITLATAGMLVLAATNLVHADTAGSITANNTSTCVTGSATSPTDCATAFAGQRDTASGIETPLFDGPGGNVSTVNIHSLLTTGNTKVYVNVMPGFCPTPDSSGTASVPRCNNNVIPEYTENNTATVDAQLRDMAQRGIDGASIDWYGPSSGPFNPDSVSLKFQSEIQNLGMCPNGPQKCQVMYMIMFDGASLKFADNPTHVTGSSNAGCATNLARPDAENCIVPRMKNDICYMNGLHFGNNAYQKSSGRPVVQFFVDESEYGNLPKTGAAPSWPDVWAQLGNFSADLKDNCASPDNAGAAHPYNVNNGAPLLIFEGVGGFDQLSSGGAFGWVQPSQSQDDLEITSSGNGRSIQEFYQAAAAHSGALTWGIAYKGFNDSQSAWGANRLLDQRCGTTWVNSMREANNFYSSTNPLPFLQVATWNDYNEGTSLEDGVNNCYTVTASVSGSTLNWQLHPSTSAASTTTISGFQVYASTDGGNTYQPFGAEQSANAMSESLAGLPAGSTKLIVKMIGQPEILNQASGPVSF